MIKRTLITAALPYANGPLHFGHIAGAYLPADCYARFRRMKGDEVLFICGSDEYGVAITISAEKEKRTPKEHVDIFHQVNKAFFDDLNMSFDHYSRTTSPVHGPIAQKFFLELREKGFIEERITNHLFSPKENRFLADRYVSGTCPKCGFENARGDECPKCGASYEATDLIMPTSKISGDKLVLKPAKHFFLRFDLFKEKLREWIKDKKWKPNVLKFAMHYIDDLKPRAITRDGDWGVPVPLEGTQGKVLYVWFDAPVGYISATMEWAEKTGKKEAWKAFWQDKNTKLINFVGKDNIPFHAVFFPAMVMGQGDYYKLVDELPANEFYNLEGRQFSKSDGWYIDLEAFFKKFSSDQIRYAIASNAPETQDSEFSWKDFQSKCNADLLGKYGNLANRVIVFAEQHCKGEVPSSGELSEKDALFVETMKRLSKEIEEAYDHFSLRRASQHLMELCQATNVYFDNKKPWVLAKEKQFRCELETTIFLCLEALKRIAIASYPIIPTSAAKLWKMLGFSESIDNIFWDQGMEKSIPLAQKLKKGDILFPKIEDSMIAEEIDKLEKLKHSPKAVVDKMSSKPLVDFTDFQKIDLRVALIEQVERVPKSKKLLRLQVDVGGEKRTIVAGIGEKMESIDSLIGKKIVIVFNLKPAMIMGIESQGMVIAAHGLEGLELPSLNMAQSGACVC